MNGKANRKNASSNGNLNWFSFFLHCSMYLAEVIQYTWRVSDWTVMKGIEISQWPRNKDFVFLPVPSLPGRLKILHLRLIYVHFYHFQFLLRPSRLSLDILTEILNLMLSDMLLDIIFTLDSAVGTKQNWIKIFLIANFHFSKHCHHSLA
jgi:hypothetical protein